MDRTTKGLACEQERNVCRARRNITKRKSYSRCSSTSPDRQSNSGILQRRWNQIEEATRTNLSTSIDTGQAEYTPGSVIFSRAIQFGARRLIPGEDLSRVASHSSCYNSYISNVGHAGSRPVCIGNSSCCSKVCVDRCERPQSASIQCLLPPVELYSSLGFSAPKSDPKGALSLEQSQRIVHFHSPEMEKSVLESGYSAPSYSATTSNSHTLIDTRTGYL